MQRPVPHPLRYLALMAIVACLHSPLAGAEERQPLLAGKGDTYLAISTQGCLGDCPIFDLYVFPNGHVIFRGHTYTARKGVVYRNVSSQAYERIRSFLETNQVFKERPECTGLILTDQSGLNVFSAGGGNHQESYWYWGSDCDVPMVDKIYELFVLETNTPALITRDTRYWQKRRREIDQENSAAK